jgi:NADH dehydrogenase
MREFAAKKMGQAGIKFELNCKVVSCTKDGARLSNGDFIRGGTIIATAGTAPHALVQRLDVGKERGRLLTEPDMSLSQYPNVWAIGDCAAVVNAFDGKLSPPTAQFAERQAKQVSYNIAARLEGKKTRPFSHKPLGMLCSIGGRNAVAEIMGLKISGFLAWFFWRGVYLMKLPSLPQKIKVGIEWGLDVILPRPLAHTREDRTKGVQRLFFQAGDFVFHEGAPATEFYMIESGNVEILQPSDGKYEQIAILGPGEFFGEGALLDNHLRQKACRAQTDVELIVLGSKLFTTISSALSPLKKAVALAIQRRTAIWQQLPELKNILDTIPLERHIEPSGNGEIQLTSPLNHVVSQMNENKLNVSFVVNENRVLVGILTRTDLLRGLEIAAALPSQKRLELQAKDIMVGEPVSLAVTDTTSLAVSMMREHGFTKLPVVESQTNRTLKGYVRIENILHDVYDHALASP